MYLLRLLSLQEISDPFLIDVNNNSAEASWTLLLVACRESVLPFPGQIWQELSDPQLFFFDILQNICYNFILLGRFLHSVLISNFLKQKVVEVERKFKAHLFT